RRRDHEPPLEGVPRTVAARGGLSVPQGPALVQGDRRPSGLAGDRGGTHGGTLRRLSGDWRARDRPGGRERPVRREVSEREAGGEQGEPEWLKSFWKGSAVDVETQSRDDPTKAGGISVAEYSVLGPV